jgi:uncharacterized membrane protein
MIKMPKYKRKIPISNKLGFMGTIIAMIGLTIYLFTKEFNFIILNLIIGFILNIPFILEDIKQRYGDKNKKL